MKYLEMIVSNLKKADIVESTRGKEGGYRLSRKADEYSVGEILRCMEDNLAPVACIKEGSVDCEKAGGCLTLPMWRELDDLVNGYLDNITLDDLISGKKWNQ
jgi:Rrf2 family protein